MVRIVIIEHDLHNYVTRWWNHQRTAIDHGSMDCKYEDCLQGHEIVRIGGFMFVI